jgi:proline iminopeptidase
LHQAWPDSTFFVVDKAGHETTTPGMNETIVAALDRFARA